LGAAVVNERTHSRGMAEYFRRVALTHGEDEAARAAASELVSVGYELLEALASDLDYGVRLPLVYVYGTRGLSREMGVRRLGLRVLLDVERLRSEYGLLDVDFGPFVTRTSQIVLNIPFTRYMSRRSPFFMGTAGVVGVCRAGVVSLRFVPLSADLPYLTVIPMITVFHGFLYPSLLALAREALAAAWERGLLEYSLLLPNTQMWRWLAFVMGSCRKEKLETLKAWVWRCQRVERRGGSVYVTSNALEMLYALLTVGGVYKWTRRRDFFYYGALRYTRIEDALRQAIARYLSRSEPRKQKRRSKSE
jgi:hypothetical protein